MQMNRKYAAFTFPRIDIDCGWAAQLLTNKKMFLPCLPMEPSRTLKSSVKIVMVSLLLTWVVFDKNVYIFKAKGFNAFPTMISACLSLPSMFTHRRIVNMCLACLSLWQEWPLKVSVLSGRQPCNRPTSCVLCISLDSHLPITVMVSHATVPWVSVSMAGLSPARFCRLGHDSFWIYSSSLAMKQTVNLHAISYVLGIFI